MRRDAELAHGTNYIPPNYPLLRAVLVLAHPMRIGPDQLTKTWHVVRLMKGCVGAITTETATNKYVVGCLV
jgi:hypothetical protein